MYNLAAGDVIEVQFVGTHFLQVTRNTMHYQIDSLVGNDDAQTRFDKWFTNMMAGGALVDQIRNCSSNQWTLQYISFQRIAPIRYALYKRGVTLTGSGIEPQPAPQISATISFSTDLATKKNKQSPRGQQSSWHHPAIPSDFYAGGKLLPGGLGFLNTLATSLKGQLLNANVDSMVPVIFHRKQTVVPQQTDLIVNAIVQQTIRVQRTRTIGKGE